MHLKSVEPSEQRDAIFEIRRSYSGVKCWAQNNTTTVQYGYFAKWKVTIGRGLRHVAKSTRTRMHAYFTEQHPKSKTNIGWPPWRMKRNQANQNLLFRATPALITSACTASSVTARDNYYCQKRSARSVHMERTSLFWQTPALLSRLRSKVTPCTQRPL